MGSRNYQTAEAVGHGPFHPEPPRETGKGAKWHKPGIDAFRAQTLPPGTAPSGSSYQPNPIHEIPSQANNDNTLRSHGKQSTFTTPLSTFPGATSADVNKGWGKPMNWQTSNELRHEGEHHRKHHGSGFEGVGATGPPKHTDASISNP